MTQRSDSAMPSPIRDNTALSRFELDAGGITAFMTYRLAGNVMTLAHTETPVAARGRGIASQLVKGVLDEMRRRGLKIVPRCPFVSRLSRQASGIPRSGGVKRGRGQPGPGRHHLNRHPEVLGAKRRASKGDGPGRTSFEARHSASKTRVDALMARTSG